MIDRRVAMISGASRGIGRAVAQALQDAGFQLSLGLRDPVCLPAGLGDAHAFAYDALDRHAAMGWTAATVAAFGRIDVLVNCAGVNPFVGFDRGDDADLDALLDINVKAPFRLIRAALPYLRAAGNGRVVNLASLSGKRVLGLNAGYQMSKHALVALTHAVRRAAWDDGVRAVAICPGFVATDMAIAATDLPPDQMTQPEDLAGLVATVVQLPNTASIAELLVNSRYETML